MYPTISVNVSCTAKRALEYAYKTLLSFGKPKDYFVKESVFTAFANIKYSFEYASCLVIIKSLSDSTCEILITASPTTSYQQNAGWIVQFHSEFIKRFSDLFEQEG